MRTLARLLVALLVAGLLGMAPGAPSPASAAVDTRSTAKVVVIVGAVHGSTPSYRQRGQEIYDAATRWSSNVVKVFSPNATWAAAKAAMQGASIVVYLGHGNGFPSPYRSSPWPYSQNGMGLNETAGNGDYNNRYYGEYYIGNEVKLAPNAVVLLTGLCYAAGNSEGGYPEPTLDVAMQRADNYAAGFLRAGAAGVVVENAGGDVTTYIQQLLTGDATLLGMWLHHARANGNEFSFPSIRTPGTRVHMDPYTPTSGFKRAFTGDPNLRSDQFRAGAASVAASVAPSAAAAVTAAAAPDTLVAPGSAEVGPDGAETYWDPELVDPTGWVLDAGTKVSVEELLYGPDPGDGTDPPILAARVREFDGWSSRWVDPADLIPGDSTLPHVVDITGPQVLTPNGDGDADTLDLGIEVSEPVAWSIELRTASGQLLASGEGSGTTVALTWNAKVGSVKAPIGAYRWDLHATDDWGNRLETSGLVTIDAVVRRIAGATNRYETAAAISAATFPPGVADVYVATGLDFPTAIPGSAAAGATGSPLLLVTRDAVPAATSTELQRLQPGRIIVLGPVGEVSDAVKTALAAYTTGSVTRIGGPDRYEVAANISRSTFAPGAPVAYIATGLNFPDALAGAAAGAVRKGPVLFVDPTQPTLPAATAEELARLQPQSIAALGGSAVVPEALLAALDAYTDGPITRLTYGTDRYGTAVAVSRATFPSGAGTVYVATGLNFPDALAAATMAGQAPGPVLLVTASAVPTVTALEIIRLNPRRIVILGGTGVVGEWVKAALRAYASR